MTEATFREQMYRRWKKGEDYFVLAKEMGVTRERMRLILKKMDAEVPLVDRIEAQAAEIERLRGDVEKRRETRMSDDDLIRRGDALYAIAGWEIPSTAISALPAVTQPAPDTAADRIKAQAAEIERLEVTVKRFAERHERHLVRVEKAEAKAEAKLENLIGGAETVLEAWDHHMRDVVVPGTLHDAIEELRADVADVNGGNDAESNL
jgi:uncharacterized small protein (DUF1192 family)